MAIQVAVSVCLLITGGLLARSLRNARTFDPGFDSSGIVLTRLHLTRHGYESPENHSFLDTLLRSLRARPEVRSASFASWFRLVAIRNGLASRFRAKRRQQESGSS